MRTCSRRIHPLPLALPHQINNGYGARSATLSVRILMASSMYPESAPLSSDCLRSPLPRRWLPSSGPACVRRPPHAPRPVCRAITSGWERDHGQSLSIHPLRRVSSVPLGLCSAFSARACSSVSFVDWRLASLFLPWALFRFCFSQDETCTACLRSMSARCVLCTAAPTPEHSIPVVHRCVWIDHNVVYVTRLTSLRRKLIIPLSITLSCYIVFLRHVAKTDDANVSQLYYIRPRRVRLITLSS